MTQNAMTPNALTHDHDALDVTPLGDDTSAWRQVLASSTNGTLFHDLDFLGYHPPERFTWRHLVIRHGSRTIAVVPAGERTEATGEVWLASPTGASTGGPAVVPDLSTTTLVQLTQALVRYAADHDFAGVELRLPPPPYGHPMTDRVGFAVAAAGFRLEDQLLTHIVALAPERYADRPGALLDARLTKTRRYEVRRAGRDGLDAREVTTEPAQLDAFWPLLEGNHARHDARPTHTRAELHALADRLGARMRLVLAYARDRPGPVAGILVFMVRDDVAYTMYIAQADPRDEPGARLGPGACLAMLMTRLTREGVRWLDLGPSSFPGYRLNDGLAFFKESFGAQGWCRDTWRFAIPGVDSHPT